MCSLPEQMSRVARLPLPFESLREYLSFSATKFLVNVTFPSPNPSSVHNRKSNVSCIFTRTTSHQIYRMCNASQSESFQLNRNFQHSRHTLIPFWKSIVRSHSSRSPFTNLKCALVDDVLELDVNVKYRRETAFPL